MSMRQLKLKIYLSWIVAGVLSGCSSGTNRENETKAKFDTMSVIKLMKKQILLDSSKVVYDQSITSEEFAKNWTVHHSEWHVEDGWLVGENRGNWPGMAILKQDFPQEKVPL